MNNPNIYTEYICPKCYSTSHKALPDELKDDQISTYYLDWYFCTECGLHTRFRATQQKTYA